MFVFVLTREIYEFAMLFARTLMFNLILSSAYEIDGTCSTHGRGENVYRLLE
jgi:hypothetical protein